MKIVKVIYGQKAPPFVHRLRSCPNQMTSVSYKQQKR